MEFNDTLIINELILKDINSIKHNLEDKDLQSLIDELTSDLIDNLEQVKKHVQRVI